MSGYKAIFLILSAQKIKIKRRPNNGRDNSKRSNSKRVNSSV